MHSNSHAALRFSRGALALFALALLSARAVQADHPETCWDGSIEIDSEPGDPIGEGERYTLYPEDADPTFGFFQRTQGPVREGYASGIKIFFRGIGRNWFFEFSTWKLDTGLLPGPYPNATRHPYEALGEPGLSITGGHYGLSRAVGNFTVLDASFDTSGSAPETRWFVAEFEYRGSAQQPALRGRVDCQVALSVQVDLKPAIREPTVNVSRDTLLPIALLGSERFDPNDVVIESLRFGHGKAVPSQPLKLKDVNHDGLLDLLVWVRMSELAFRLSDTELCVDGDLENGRHLYGCDAIVPELSVGIADWAFESEFPGRGWFSDDGFHAAFIDNTYTGSVDQKTYNSFLSWGLQLLGERRVRHASLRLWLDRYASRESSESIEIHDVSHERDTLLADHLVGDATGIAVYQDLQSGALYGSFEATRLEDTYLVPLSEAAVDQINRDLESGRRFAVGIHNATSDLDLYDDAVRFNTIPGKAPQLILTLEPLPRADRSNDPRPE